MPTIKLWYSPGACSLASHILLRETGLDFEAIEINVKAGAPEHLRSINPKKRVPVLSIDDEIITETPAIMTAISQLVPDKHLMGGSSLEIVRVYEWLNYLSGTLHGQYFGGLFRPHRFSDDDSALPALKAKARQNVETAFSLIEGKLTGVHAVGKAFTAVDAFLYICHRWGASVGLDVKHKYPEYTRLAQEVARRESVQAALRIEGIE